ncbi:7TM diverse intracellular signaling domain-containing protein [Sediminitomix flava]|uniref:Serine phosphatase RsbU (Regulator of sigma subunit) n=1 Tax=Sediminitomix flava TaxID=379075 RepID=A0A315Z1Z9_SEDFL|nr:7TM diverse intracellular signaling domain-containing protein [Sediminitomix flava]PWJ36080.1 serine phosphatase RsbU (regulator of sigma subunit) [Sediminitomix flava]
MRLFLYFFLLPILLFQHTAFAQTPQQSLIQKGILDLSEKEESFYDELSKLDGEWEFYWNELLYPIDFINTNPETHFIHMPEVWSEQTLGDKIISPYGYGTYRLVMKHGLEEGTRLGLKIPTLATSYRLYVDGELKAVTGYVSDQEEKGEAGYNTRVPTFGVKGKSTEFIIQVSNYHHRKGGTWDSIHLGSEETIRSTRELSVMKDLFLVGCLLAMGLYHLMLYYFRQKDRSALYFAISCISIAFRTLSTGEYLWLELFPSTPWVALTRMEYISYFVPIFSIATFVYFVFSKNRSKNFVTGIGIAVAIMVLITLVTPASIFSYLVPVSHAVIGVASLYCIYLIILALKKRVTGSIIFAFSVLFFIACIVNDMLYQQEVIHTRHMMAIGFFSFIFTQGFMLSYRLSSAFNRTEDLSQKLNDANQNLEATVEERTKDLTEVNEELSLQNQYINNQKRELEKVSQVLQKRNIEITAGINYAHRIQRSMLPSATKVEQLLGKENYFVLYKPKDILSGDFYMVEEIDGKVIVISADCTGHGVPGALMSMVGQQILSEVIFRKNITTPHQILAELHVGIMKSLQQNITQNNDSIDLSICIIDDDDSKLYFAGAKSSILLINDQGEHILKGERFSAGGKGGTSTPEFKTQEITFEKGTVLYMYSDGYQDQFGGENNSKFLAKNFRSLLKRNFLLPFEKQKELLANIVQDWQKDGKEKQTDDILVIGIRL